MMMIGLGPLTDWGNALSRSQPRCWRSCSGTETGTPPRLRRRWASSCAAMHTWKSQILNYFSSYFGGFRVVVRVRCSMSLHLVAYLTEICVPSLNQLLVCGCFMLCSAGFEESAGVPSLEVYLGSMVGSNGKQRT